MWFRKRRKQRVVDIINELRDAQAIKKKISNARIDKSTIFVLDPDRITHTQHLVKVIRLLDKGGMTFMLTGDDIKEYKDIVKNKYE